MTTTAGRSYEPLAQAAERTGISTKTLRRHIAAGALTAYRCGRLIRLDPGDGARMMVRVPNTGERTGYSVVGFDILDSASAICRSRPCAACW